MPTQDETAQAIAEYEKRDELLRQIGEQVVERVDDEGKLYVGIPGHLVAQFRICPSCGELHESDHADDCPLTRYLEATDG